ncbi:hypothetical protein [Haloprofundus halophilus]|uniref:hypothetical protein n=1 Tax=Haloprofundus halophilus TaxID=2283527 RepID=UPI0013004DB2|nr:hypothetical protein [Haloprofundus halophilus]
MTDSLSKVYKTVPHVGSVSYVATEQSIGGTRLAQPEIAVVPGTSDAKREALPESTSEAPIQVPTGFRETQINVREMDGEFINLNVDCGDDTVQSPFPGGLEITDTNSNYRGTAGFKVWDSNDNEYMYTANHVLNNGDCQVATDGMADANGSRLGDTADGHKTHDWVVVNDNDSSYDNTVAFNEGDVTIDGYATQNGMESIQGEQGTLQFQGIISGKQDAYVKGGGASYYSGCVKMFGSATKYGVPDYVREGDSGGPFWWEKSGGDNLIAGSLTGSEDSGSYSGCGSSGKKGRPAYGYPFWRVANNTSYTVKDV